MTKPVPFGSEELYKEFYRNGNRSHYQEVYFARNSRLSLLASAELVENQGRFLPALEETIRAICEYPSWTLPAHDPGGLIYDGKGVASDLCSTYLGGCLALIRQAMMGVLPEDLSDLIAQNVERRILTPYEAMVRDGVSAPDGTMWWVVGTNNWNPVCHCGTLCSALLIRNSPSERAWFLASSEYFVSRYFFDGFTNDGYCSEGIGYWNYGFGNFTEMAEIAYRVTVGGMNLYALPKVKAVTEYALKMEIEPERFAAFADCYLGAHPDKTILALLSRRLGLGMTKIETENRFATGTGDLIRNAAFLFPPPESLGDGPALPESEWSKTTFRSPLEEPFSFFEDAGILIARAPLDAKSRFSAVFKGGHNDEHHNHNDLGTFGILYHGNWLIQDPGGEIYTSRTFSPRRYEGELLNSFGHPVPRINGKLQAPGRERMAVVLEKDFSPEKLLFTLDLTSAYPDCGAEKVIRRFEFFQPAGEGTNRLVVTDRIEFAPDQQNEVEIPFITFQDWEMISDGSPEGSTFLIREKLEDEEDEEKKPVSIRLTLKASDENDVSIPGVLSESLVGENDDQVARKPTRIAFTPDMTGNDSRVIEVVTEITPND